VYAEIDMKSIKKSRFSPTPTPPGTTPQDSEKVVYSPVKM